MYASPQISTRKAVCVCGVWCICVYVCLCGVCVCGVLGFISPHRILERQGLRASEMAQRVRALAPETNDRSWIPRTHGKRKKPARTGCPLIATLAGVTCEPQAQHTPPNG